MRVLFDHPWPFALAHGGFQTQIQQTAEALGDCGVEVEFVRWWDDSQRGDLIHYFGTAPLTYIQLAAGKGMPIVMTTLFTATCNRSDVQLTVQGYVIRNLLRVQLATGIKQQLGWPSHGSCACNVVGLDAERKVLELVYGVPRERIAIVPLGLSEVFLMAGQGRREKSHLICTGTITERKNSVQLAELAKAAGVPILFVGKPYSAKDSYWKRFESLIDERIVRYEPHVTDEREMVHKLHSARGFVIMSEHENWCLSAHEAAACGLPVLLPDQKWSRARFGDQATYFRRGFTENVRVLKEFYERSAVAPPPRIQLFSWREAAEELAGVYNRVLSNSR